MSHKGGEGIGEFDDGREKCLTALTQGEKLRVAR